MVKKIHISISCAGAYLEALSRISIRKMGFRGVYAYLKGNDSANYKTIRSVWIAGSTQPHEIDALLCRGMQLLGISTVSSKGDNLEVSLGAGSAYTGIMRLRTDEADKLPHEAVMSLANAWISQVWAIPMAEYVVRVAPVEQSRHYLITCIDRRLFEALQQFSCTLGMRFTKCRAALVDIILETFSATRERAQDGARIEALTEVAAPSQSSMAQFVLVSEAHPIVIHRFYANASRPDEFKAITRRIAAQHGLPGNIALNIRHWPVTAEGRSP